MKNAVWISDGLARLGPRYWIAMLQIYFFLDVGHTTTSNNFLLRFISNVKCFLLHKLGKIPAVHDELKKSLHWVIKRNAFFNVLKTFFLICYLSSLHNQIKKHVD